jgi:hypothetical protein
MVHGEKESEAARERSSRERSSLTSKIQELIVSSVITSVFACSLIMKSMLEGPVSGTWWERESAVVYWGCLKDNGSPSHVLFEPAVTKA